MPIVFQAVFAIVGDGCMCFHPDTPRWYYARDRFDEDDAILTRLIDASSTNAPSTDDAQVQEVKGEILLAIESELQANASLHWRQFVTMGIIDHTPSSLSEG